MSEKEPHTISKLKEWASPTLFAILGMLLWRDISEMRQDVKVLLTQQTVTSVKIQVLESEINLLKNHAFTNKDDSQEKFFRQPAKKEDEVTITN